MSYSADEQKFIAEIDKNKSALIKRLADACAIPSVSGDAKYRKHVFEMADWLLAELKSLGATAELRQLGKQTLDGQEIDLPPVIFGDYKSGSADKKTLLVYGHYDVQPALKSDGWNTEPFTLYHDEKTGRMYARGSTDDKGPILGWLAALEAHQKAGVELPVNLKFCFEGMEESGSVGLDELIVKEKDAFFAGVDACCISDNYWLGTTKPCITHGLRGISYFKLQIQGPGADLHSGVFGGVVHEPMTDVVQLMSRLVTPQGEILVPGIKEQVAALTPEEAKRYEVMDFTIADMNAATNSQTTISDKKEDVLMARMRYPSLSLHGIEGAFAEPGTKTVIPSKVIGKFSLRLVPDMTPEKVEAAVVSYLEAEFKKLGSKNKMTIALESAGKPWFQSVDHPNFQAAIKATEAVYGVTPDLTREDEWGDREGSEEYGRAYLALALPSRGSIPVALTFSETLQKSLVLLPMGRGDDGAHSINEKLDIGNYIEGSKLLGVYLHQAAKLL